MTRDGFKDYGLYPGDRIKIESGSGCICREPDWVDVIDELPDVILCKYYFRHWNGRTDSYKHCLNKAGISSGEIKFRKIGEAEWALNWG